MVTCDVATKDPPTALLWRVARRPDPLSLRQPQPLPPELSTAGNRFDSLTGRFGCLYLGTMAEGCMMEVLGRLRPDQRLRELVADEWADRGWMHVGNVPADWRARRCRVQVAVDLMAPPFLDADAAVTLGHLDRQLRPYFDQLGLDQLDTSAIRARDRRVTRRIADWAWDHRCSEHPVGFGGLRYVSRLDSDQEWWGDFDDVEVREMARTSIEIRDPDVTYAARRLGLTLH